VGEEGGVGSICCSIGVNPARVGKKKLRTRRWLRIPGTSKTCQHSIPALTPLPINCIPCSKNYLMPCIPLGALQHLVLREQNRCSR
jgi:hypothetical protein